MTEQAGASPEQPLYFKWVRDADGKVNWGRVLLALSLTALSAYVSVRAQRAGASPDGIRTMRMSAAQKQISMGVRIQRAGKRVEEAGWRAYEASRQ